MKKSDFTIVLVVLTLFLSLVQSPAIASSKKPMHPLRISIAPVQAGLTPDQLKPGDTVALTVIAVSAIDAAAMNINIDLIGGAKLVSGVTSWSGPAVKNASTSITITVQAPQNGKGRVRAKVTLPSSGSAHYSSQAQFELGPRPVAKPAQEPVIKKDSKGRNIIEYR